MSRCHDLPRSVGRCWLCCGWGPRVGVRRGGGWRASRTGRPPRACRMRAHPDCGGGGGGAAQHRHRGGPPPRWTRRDDPLVHARTDIGSAVASPPPVPPLCVLCCMVAVHASPRVRCLCRARPQRLVPAAEGARGGPAAGGGAGGPVQQDRPHPHAAGRHAPGGRGQQGVRVLSKGLVTRGSGGGGCGQGGTRWSAACRAGGRCCWTVPEGGGTDGCVGGFLLVGAPLLVGRPFQLPAPVVMRSPPVEPSRVRDGMGGASVSPRAPRVIHTRCAHGQSSGGAAGGSGLGRSDSRDGLTARTPAAAYQE